MLELHLVEVEAFWWWSLPGAGRGGGILVGAVNRYAAVFYSIAAFVYLAVNNTAQQ